MDATTNQINFIADLLIKLHADNGAEMLLAILEAGTLTKAGASTKIDALKAQLKAQADAKIGSTPVKLVPAGWYLAMGKKVQVKISKKSGAPYLLAQDGTYLGALKGDAPAMLAQIEADPQGCAIAYGKATGTCGICSKELTNPESIAAGIGPVCAKKF